MTNSESRKPWRECKAIAQALSPATSSDQELMLLQRKVLLSRMAAQGPDAAALAAKLANVNAPVEATEAEALAAKVAIAGEPFTVEYKGLLLQFGTCF